MRSELLASRRSAVVLGVGLLAGAVLTGCAGATPTPTAPAAATESAEGSGDPDEPTAADSPLAPGLLPADELGDGAEVHRFDLDGMPFAGGWHHRADDGDLSVTPAACGTALEEAASRFTGVQDAVGQVARTEGVRTFEVLAVVGTDVDVVGQVQALLDECADVSLDRGADADDHGPAGVRVDELSGAPDGMVAFSVTVSGEKPDGGTWSGTSLVGVAQDGDRVLGLAQMSWDEELDPASFIDLLDQAYDAQAGLD
jgi:hypothetical protein